MKSPEKDNRHESKTEIQSQPVPLYAPKDHLRSPIPCKRSSIAENQKGYQTKSGSFEFSSNYCRFVLEGSSSRLLQSLGRGDFPVSLNSCTGKLPDDIQAYNESSMFQRSLLQSLLYTYGSIRLNLMIFLLIITCVVFFIMVEKLMF